MVISTSVNKPDPKRPLILWDYDDTLGGVLIDGEPAMNGMAYERILKEFAESMDEMGLHGSLEVQQKVDSALCKIFGFGAKERFAESLVETYMKMVEKRGGPHPNVSKRFHALGMSVWKYPYTALPGAIETLQALKDFSHVVVTKGPRGQQRKKLADSGILPLIDRLFVCERKNDAEWMEVFEAIRTKTTTHPTSWWAVGNSPNGDLSFPLRLGANGVLVKSYIWDFEMMEKICISSDQQLQTVTSVREVPGVILGTR